MHNGGMGIRYGAGLFYVIVLAGATSAFAPSARAACTMPSGSYAGVKAGGDYYNSTGITGTTSIPIYSASSVTITSFPTTSSTGTYTSHGKISITPPNGLQNSIIETTGVISKITGYDTTTCSGIITIYANQAATPINCTSINSCVTGTKAIFQLKSTYKFTSSQGGAHVTLAPIGIDPLAPGSFTDLWRQ